MTIMKEMKRQSSSTRNDTKSSALRHYRTFIDDLIEEGLADPHGHRHIP
jgi:hypothetical protein